MMVEGGNCETDFHLWSNRWQIHDFNELNDALAGDIQVLWRSASFAIFRQDA